ncbi:nickel insertion protein [Zhaonella formicivorans]|uniref:nickel insertion protein n=1 Tax=Zhaonella formicivorans TaxID=2528593 RepID=UPI0010D908E1|nr:nickel insertion protein [Zhaonella formicivorans]
MHHLHPFLTDETSTIQIWCARTGAEVAWAMEKLFQKGALDVFFSPLAQNGSFCIKVTVLCPRAQEHFFLELIGKMFSDSRISLTRQTRYKLHRDFIKVRMYGEEVRVKCGYMLQEKSKTYLQVVPEYEDCKLVAKSTGLALKTIYDLAKSLALQQLNTAR